MEQPAHISLLQGDIHLLLKSSLLIIVFTLTGPQVWASRDIPDFPFVRCIYQRKKGDAWS